ncbi:hypothetical protein A6M27_02680 [Acidithiobacillus thiooxidans]|uniref:Uncharacterized protein n=1 Tax=Acidithiobacillus thiooxidans TaxID=930 RepID=A0A1C2IK12_ACITH|nr:hypothetical protein [Acidithiobacillus thiooxidans]OCX71660.1 hypothetical protein A6O24_15205 [Acidithiobacillus thiooxidans]OCX76275.1 hypothetical protein A6P07_02970 [Acidithiobacillus thiooxidans]OCX78473.1 hypothetical protein A6O26_17990 [Acidithiobacillus thiooxidans]OCX89254.1 hypothetical protein A6M27_02680 [Acidithiobacillus thiooxidans]OFC42630.1 hypothetical protein BAE47_14880 [Acidithiobacillus thiooxidans]
MYKTTDTFNSNTTPATVRRDGYGAIRNLPTEIKELVETVKKSAGWETGVTSEGMKRGGFESRNIDVYGYDVAHNLAVIQIRRAWKKKESWYTEVSKAYALVGIDEGQVFSHPLASSPRRNPHLDDMAPEEVVAWAESKIFGVPVNKLHTITRQGDIALVPVRGIPHDALPMAAGRFGLVTLESGVHVLTLRGSHQVHIDGEVFEADGTIYAEGAIEIMHSKGEHKAVCATGKLKVVTGEVGDSPWWLNAEMGD